MATTAELDLLRKMALPSLVGQYIGKKFYGKPWIAYPWIQYVEQRVIEAVNDRDHERFIIVNAPPQTGKSSYIGELLPFWLSGMFPDDNQMYISYSDEFSETRSKQVRALQAAWGKELFGTSIDPDFNKVAEWRIKGHRGGMLAVGIGGLITGKPGDIIIIDDLIKNEEEARSEAAKRKHLGEWDSTIFTRLQPGGTVIVIATRWAEDDLSGALISRMNQPGYSGPKWEVLSFPAFAEPSEEMEGELTTEELATWRDIIGREYGEVLDCRFSRIKGREPEAFFRMKEASTDPVAYSCLYQQRPFNAKGSMFARENWRYYSPLDRPEMEQLVRVWDLATTDGGGDWTVGTKMGRHDGKLYVLDVIRFRKGSGEVLNKVIETAGVDGYGCSILVEEEKGGAGKSTVAALQKMLPGYDVQPAKAEGDKKSRAMLASSEQQNNRMLLPNDDEVAWDVPMYRNELVRMMQDGRMPKHDDQIDTTSYGAIFLVGGRPTEMWIPDLGESLTPEALMDYLESQSVGDGAYS